MEWVCNDGGELVTTVFDTQDVGSAISTWSFDFDAELWSNLAASDVPVLLQSSPFNKGWRVICPHNLRWSMVDGPAMGHQQGTGADHQRFWGNLVGRRPRCAGAVVPARRFAAAASFGRQGLTLREFGIPRRGEFMLNNDCNQIN